MTCVNPCAAEAPSIGRMFPLIRPAAGRRYIQDGRVFCPTRQRDVEFDFCAGCAALTEMQPDLEYPYIRCRPEPVFAAPIYWLP